MQMKSSNRTILIFSGTPTF